MSAVTAPSERRPLAEAYEELRRRHHQELRLADALAGGGGISGLVAAAAEMTPNPLWLIDTRHRVVAHSTGVRGADFRPPDLAVLLGAHGPVDLTHPEPFGVPPAPGRGLSRGHVVAPVGRDGRLQAWLVVAEVSSRLGRDEWWLAARTAFHLTIEYGYQRRVARASWNARSTLARQLVRGSVREADLRAAADYLGVQADADRVLVYVSDRADDGGDELDDELLAELVGRELSREVLGARGSEGTILLVEVDPGIGHVAYVHRVKQVLRQVLDRMGDVDAVVGVSAVSDVAGLQRSYREARQVIRCVERFARGGGHIIAVDDLGPARLFVAGGDAEGASRYARDVLGGLLGGAPGMADLLRTLHGFFDTGRSVRATAARLGIHENTVRLRLGRVRELVGLDVAGDANDQLSVQTALLVLRVEGHPDLPSFDEIEAEVSA